MKKIIVFALSLLYTSAQYPPQLSQSSILSMFQSLDINNDGKLSPSEIQRQMKTSLFKGSKQNNK